SKSCGIFINIMAFFIARICLNKPFFTLSGSKRNDNLVLYYMLIPGFYDYERYQPNPIPPIAAAPNSPKTISSNLLLYPIDYQIKPKFK
ncbi:MAG: hypothetical protein ACQEV7_20295, partial [Bacillota bacterium]